MEVIKKDDRIEVFDKQKIINAIGKANASVDEKDRVEDVSKIMDTIMRKLNGFTTIRVDDIHDIVEQSLVRHNKYALAKEYIIYRDQKKKDKLFNEIESKALSLVDGTSDLRGDNANKRIDDNGAISDYLAGILTKSINDKTLPKDIIEAHKKGLIHWHDSDYSPLRPMHNCDLLNVEDMLTNGFQMMNAKIEPTSTTSFRTICNLISQISLIVSGRQYGGQTISWAHLLPYVQTQREQLYKKYKEIFVLTGVEDDLRLKYLVERDLRDEIKRGVKIYQYQILCHSSSNGQTPFVSNNLCLSEAQTKQELDDFAMIIEEIFKCRLQGIKDRTGHWVTPLFPKLLYWECEGLNVNPDDPYYYLTQLAAECEVKRCQPDINSEKICRQIKEGQIIPSMGCRSLLSPIWEETEYPIDTEFFIEKGAYEYPYDKFNDKSTFIDVPNGIYERGDYAVNFRGNTGWLIYKDNSKVVIMKPIVYGRWNNGVITINLPHVALEAKESGKEGEELMNEFYKILTDRLNLIRKGLKIRWERVSNIKGKNSEILWCHGALARISPEETVGQFMEKYPKRASISVGYVGLYEVCRTLISESNTSEKGIELSLNVLQFMNDTLNTWKKEDGYGYSIYGTPEESLTYKFAMANRRDFGVIEYVTDKDYVVNSYHVDPREEIDAFKKLEIEGKFLSLSVGGAVSYVETLDLSNNKKVILNIMRWMYDHILYAEFNRKIGICYECGYEGDIDLIRTDDGNFVFKCPCCGNTDDNKMDVTARLCGYLGKVNAGNTNKGRLDDIYNRVIHLDNREEKAYEV